MPVRPVRWGWLRPPGLSRRPPPRLPVLPPHDDRRNMYGIDMTGDPQSRRPPSQGPCASAARDASAARIVGDATALERLCPRAVPACPSPAVYMGRFTISGHWSWLVCGHESLELRSYLGIGSEAVFCCCCCRRVQTDEPPRTCGNGLKCWFRLRQLCKVGQVCLSGDSP